MLKIAHIDTGASLGGGQRQLLLLARRLRERGHEQWIVCPEASELERRARQEGFRLLALPSHDPGHVRGALKLRHFCKAERFEILHAHDGGGQTAAWLSSAFLQVRRVASRRVTFLPRWRVLHRLKYQNTCDAVIAVSNYVKDLLLRSGVPGKMIEVIYDGIEIPPLLPGAEERSAIRRRWGFHDGDFVVGNLGAFRPEKGHETAREAAGRLAGAFPQIKWWFAAQCESTKDERGLRVGMQEASKVRIIPAPEDPSEFFATLDLYVMPSLAEGLGSSALLAMAHGLPVAASRAGGLPEIVEEGKTGWLFRPGSAEELADVVLRAAQNRQELDGFGANARRRALGFSDDIMAARTESLYLKLRAGYHDD